MAQSLVIRNQCDVCLSVDKVTPADTYRIDLRVMAPALHVEAATPARPEDNPAPFVVELCPEHGAAVCDAVLALVPLGRAPEDAPARRPASAGKSGPVPFHTPGAVVACPKCGETAASVSALRGHVRKEHDTSLAGIGFYPANFTCAGCGDAFPNRQGLSAHSRVRHPGVKQPA